MYIYAQQDVNDRINPKGWSFAVARVSNASTYYLVPKLLNNPNLEIKELGPVLVNMLQEHGFMHYMNVGHLDELTDKNISLAADDFVSAFISRLPKK